MDDLGPPPGPDGWSGSQAGATRIIAWVAIAVLAWGVVQAIGAWRFNHDPLRAVVVLACVTAFLGFWMAMLAVRRRRLSRRR